MVSTLTANTLTVTTSGTFGICYAQQFVTLSDMLAKKDIRPLESVLNGIDKIQAYRFSYFDASASASASASGQTLGLLAQEVEAVWPELVVCSSSASDKKYVNYDGLVSILVKAVQELSQRVRALESKAKE